MTELDTGRSENRITAATTSDTARFERLPELHVPERARELGAAFSRAFAHLALVFALLLAETLATVTLVTNANGFPAFVAFAALWLAAVSVTPVVARRTVDAVAARF